MKKLLLFSVLSPLCLFAAVNDKDPNDNMLVSNQDRKMFGKEMKTTNQAVTKDIAKKEQLELAAQNEAKIKESEKNVAASSMAHGSSDVMIVDPNVMAKDWVNAFDALTKKKQNGLTFVLKDQSTISDVAGLEAMPGGYLILFTQRTVRGIQYRIIKTSEIASLESR